MIDAKELRIGNLVKSVYAPYGHPQDSKMEVVDIHILERINDYRPSDNFIYYPINITPEIIEKCGFQHTHFGNFYRIDNGKFSPWLEWEGDFFDVMVGDPEYSIGELKYVHQLQNIYFILCGEELQVNI